jgi:hypothetical protein
MQTKVIEKGEIEKHFKTKKGLHQFLTVECDFFLPPIMFTNSDWLRLIWQGKKRVRYYLVILYDNYNSRSWKTNSSFMQHVRRLKVPTLRI